MWYYKNEEFKLENYPNESLLGFVYQITESDTNKKYIGKKLFYTNRKKKLKGKVKRVIAESDWKNYYGSRMRYYGRRP